MSWFATRSSLRRRRPGPAINCGGLVSARRLLSVGVILTVVAGGASPRAAADPAWLDAYRDPAARLIGEAVGSTFAWERLAVLTDSIGHRISGSESLNRAIRWALEEMKRDGLENV